MKFHALKLNPNDDLRLSLESWARENNIKAAAVLSSVGSLKVAAIRFADAKQIEQLQGPFEICGLTGTLSNSGGHFHMMISDGGGKVLGGHLCAGSLIHTTAELVIISSDQFEFLREFDQQTGYKELKIK